MASINKNDDLERMKNQALFIGSNDRERQELCRIEVMNTLKKFRCVLIPSITFRGDGAIMPQVDVIAINDKKGSNNGNGKAG